MAKKSSKKNKNNKNIVIGAFVGILALVVVIVMVVMLAKNNKVIDDSYFVSDDTKYVVTLDGDLMKSPNDEGDTPLRAYLVYYYSDDKITGLETYYDYGSDDAAKLSYEAMQGTDGGKADSYKLNGKYIVMVADASEYEGMTAADAKKQVEFTEFLKSMTSGNSSDGDKEDVDEESYEDVVEDSDESVDDLDEDE